MSVPSGAAGHHEAARLSVAYVALFALVGIYLPYWPVWLANRGMEPDQIGAILGMAIWARLVVPWVGRWADGGHARHLAVYFATLHVVFVAAFAWAHGFAALLLLSAISGLCYAPVGPLVEGIAVTASGAGRIDYGRVRLWGSAAFVLASAVAGLALEGRSPSLVWAAILFTAVALCAASWWLPSDPGGRIARASQAAAPARVPATRSQLITFLVAVGFMQGSHAVLYVFGTRHWQSIGIPESVIGGLWAWGVITEVGLFAIGKHLVPRLGPAGLLVLSGLGGVIRWPILGGIDSLAIIAPAQTLHAFTFAAMHLGAMSWIRDSVAPSEVQRTTGLYVAVSTGLALGLGMPLAGVLYERFAGHAYYAMAVASGAGALLALRLLRRPAA